MSELKFEEPPGRQDRADHEGAARQLKARPHEWAVFHVYTSSESSRNIAYYIRNGLSGAWAPKGAFEAKARTVGGEHRVYARYVGGDDV